MKPQTNWLTAALIATGALVVAASAQAQSVTDFSLIPASGPNAPSYSGYWPTPLATISSTPTGLEINAPGGSGSFSQLYYAIPLANQNTLNPLDTQVTFDFTWNSGNAVAGVNVLFALDDANGGTDYYGTGYLVPTPGLNSYTFPLMSPNAANVAAGYDINGINFQIDPANVSGNYDITFNSLTLSAVPEPTTVALASLGVASLVIFRRRK
jgi:hypothetical protein